MSSKVLSRPISDQRPKTDLEAKSLPHADTRLRQEVPFGDCPSKPAQNTFHARRSTSLVCRKGKLYLAWVKIRTDHSLKSPALEMVTMTTSIPHLSSLHCRETLLRREDNVKATPRIDSSSLLTYFPPHPRPVICHCCLIEVHAFRREVNLATTLWLSCLQPPARCLVTSLSLEYLWWESLASHGRTARGLNTCIMTPQQRALVRGFPASVLCPSHLWDSFCICFGSCNRTGLTGLEGVL